MKTSILHKHPETGRVYLRESIILSFFVRPPIHESVDGYRQAVERYLSEIPNDALTWSSVGAASEQWKPMTTRARTRALGLLRADAAAKRSMTAFEFTDGEVGGDAPGYSIKVLGEPLDAGCPDQVDLLQMTFPMEHLEISSVAVFVAFCRDVASLVPYVSGYAAPGLLWAELNSGLAAFEAKPIAIRHPGYDVQNNEATRLRLGKRARGAYWLTFLGPELVEALGGHDHLRAQLSSAIALDSAGHGLVIRAGELPEVGDVNKSVGVPLLREVARAIEPVTAFADRALLGQFTNFDQDYFDRWDRRLFT